MEGSIVLQKYPSQKGKSKQKQHHSPLSQHPREPKGMMVLQKNRHLCAQRCGQSPTKLALDGSDRSLSRFGGNIFPDFVQPQ